MIADNIISGSGTQERYILKNNNDEGWAGGIRRNCGTPEVASQALRRMWFGLEQKLAHSFVELFRKHFPEQGWHLVTDHRPKNDCNDRKRRS